jgi:hypothetical protein
VLDHLLFRVPHLAPSLCLIVPLSEPFGHKLHLADAKQCKGSIDSV